MDKKTEAIITARHLTATAKYFLEKPQGLPSASIVLGEVESTLAAKELVEPSEAVRLAADLQQCRMEVQRLRDINYRFHSVLLNTRSQTVDELKQDLWNVLSANPDNYPEPEEEDADA